MISPQVDSGSSGFALLDALGALESGAATELDRVTRLACHRFGTSSAIVVLAGADGFHLKSRHGRVVSVAGKGSVLCMQAIQSADPVIVEDAEQLTRYAEDGSIVADNGIRFFAGQAIRSRQGVPLGAFCLVDAEPRELSREEIGDLVDFACMVEQYFHGLESDLRAETAEKHRFDADTQFEQTFLHASIGIALVSLEGRWLRVNQCLCDIVGYDEATLMNMTFQDITHPDDLEADLDLVRQVLAGDIATYTMEKRYFRADGSIVWVELTVALMRDVNGNPWQFISVVNDISARKLAEAELAVLHHELEARVAQRTEELSIVVKQLNHQIEKRVTIQQTLVVERERFYSTLENAPDAYVQLDTLGNITAWNLAAERMSGWSRTEVVGREFVEIVVPEGDRATRIEDFQRVVRDGTPTIPDFRFEISALRRDGSEFPAELKLGESRAGDTRLIDVFLQDISRRKAAEKAVLDAKERLATITDNMPALIAYVGTDLRYQFNNRAYLDWFGKSPDALLGTRLPDFVSEHSTINVARHIDRALSGQRVAFENALKTPQGEMWVQTTFVPAIADDGEVEGFYILSHDVTDRKALEQRLVYEATHDTLTALPNRRAFMQTIVNAAKRAKRSRQGMALLFLDLDGFKQLNDVHGHEFGDRVLQYFATTLVATVRETDTVCRLAGDEFTIVLESLHEPKAGSERVAQKILERLRQTAVIDGISVQLASSIGIASVDAGESTVAESLIARADAAMYRAKAAGKARYAVN